MKITLRVADYIAQRLVALGATDVFCVTGGGAMHLNDAFGAAPGLDNHFFHHEQGAAMAAEVYARLADRPALLSVTSGPGGINAINGVFGAFTDSIPMIVVSGQVKRETLRVCQGLAHLRQIGDQELDIQPMIQGITKFSTLLTEPSDIIELLDQAYMTAVSGRPGPVWIDVPVDVQGQKIDIDSDQITKPLAMSHCEAEVEYTLLSQVADLLKNSRRPVVLGGTGIRIGKAVEELRSFIDLTGLPFVSAWTHDLLETEHPRNFGRAGTIGTRAGNFVIQNADLVIVIGSRLNIRQTSYNWDSFARNAKIIWIDIDPSEFEKPFVKADLKITADAGAFMRGMSNVLQTNIELASQEWVNWCTNIRSEYSPKSTDYPVSTDRINAYHLIEELFGHLAEDDIVVCGDATATIVPYQIGKIKRGMRLISNSGCASMGYDIPGAAGAAIAEPNRRIICLAGDGSSMMNIQELQTLSELDANLKVIILDNDGYLSIKQTQRNFFGRESGSSSTSGLSFPCFEKVGEAFGLASIRIGKESWVEKLSSFLALPGSGLAVVELDLIQEFEPRLKSKMVGETIQTPELDDMYPFLDSDILDFIRSSAADV